MGSGDDPGDRKAGRPPRARPQETLRVRSRDKNPQIGRRPSEADAETEHVDLEDLGQAAGGLMDDDATEVASGPPSAGSAKSFEVVIRKRDEESDTTHSSKGGKVRAPPPTVRPRAGMEMLGTAGAEGLVQRAKIEKLEAQIGVVRSPHLKPFRGHLDDRELSALDRALAGELDSRELGVAGSSPKRGLERLIHSPELQRLVLEDRALLLRSVAQDPREIETMKAATRLIEVTPWGRLNAPERRELVELFALLGPAERGALAELAGRGLHGKSAIEAKDFEDARFVAHALGLARSRSLGARVEQAGYTKNQALAALFAAVASPAKVPLEDGASGVVSVFEFALAETSVAEYARLWRGLVTDDLVVELPDQGRLDLGEHLKARPGLAFRGADNPLRVGMDLLAGLAHPRSGPIRAAFVMPGGHGIDADVTARALGYLYGIGFTVAAGATGALRQLERAQKDRFRVPPTFVTLLYDGGERLFVYDRIENDRVFLRGPHGASTKPKGGRRLDPERTVEEPELGLDSVSLAFFTEQVGVALVPRT
ncbi:MAG: hypothetical protein U1E65_00595 [Myxococcota bacterium]